MRSMAQCVSGAWYRAGATVMVQVVHHLPMPAWLRKEAARLGWVHKNPLLSEQQKRSESWWLMRGMVARLAEEAGAELVRELVRQFRDNANLDAATWCYFRDIAEVEIRAAEWRAHVYGH